MPDLHDYGTGKAPKPPRSFPADTRPRWFVEPRTFDDLLQRAGPYADGTKAHVEWGAVAAWHMSGNADEALAAAFIPGEVASLSVLLTRQAVEHEAGWPQLSDRRVTPALYDLPEDAQGIARRMAAEVYSLWEAAGRPHFDARRFKDAHRHLVACVRSGSIPPVLTIGEVPPLPAPAPSKFIRPS
ncbi:MAG: hypothetical protein K0R56_2330 [Sphingomonas sp.]|nr:hypothetical protein [Sphingomonas sp.]